MALLVNIELLFYLKKIYECLFSISLPIIIIIAVFNIMISGIFSYIDE